MIKKISKLIYLFALVFILLGCEMGGVTPKKNITLTAKQPSITLNVGEVLTHDYTKYFSIIENNRKIDTLAEFIDISNLQDTIGSYIVNCKYENSIAYMTVNVVANKDVNITTIKDVVEVTSLNLYSEDYTKYFVITLNGEEVEVLPEYLNLENLSPMQGEYPLFCTYSGVSHSIKVKVVEVEYQIKLDPKEITIKQSLVDTYDYLSLFTLVVNGKIQKITEDMITNNVNKTIGKHTYVVKYGETQMTLNVNVISDYDITIINSYELYELEENLIDSFDYTELFSVYVDGEYKPITNDIISTNCLENALVNTIYPITITYTLDDAVKQATCNVLVIPTKQAQITSKNIATYPNGDFIDLKSLFTITKDGKDIEVTMDMISGSVDYSVEGENIITINYEGIQKQAIVEVKQGVIINTLKDEIEIAKNTNISTYDFSKDFNVLINGVTFDNISSFVDTSNVDFTTPGDYEVSINIPYTDTSLNISKGTIFTKTITYKVVDTIYEIKTLQDLVILPSNTTSYDYLNNLSLKVNGINQKLVKNPSLESPIAKYATLVNDSIDFTYKGIQDVEVAIYVYGSSSAPVITTYKLMVESNIKVTAIDKVEFVGSTIFTKDLFTITLDGEEIEVTQDMVSGKVDSSTPGNYLVKINYQGFEKISTVVIISDEIIGTYKTTLKTLKQDSYEDEEGYTIEGSQQTTLKNLYITKEGKISVNGTLAEIVNAINENTLQVKINANIYTLYYNNGIVMLDPNNDIKLAFNDYKRPLIYFDESKYEIDSHFVINSTSTYVLNNTIVAYSFDIFKIKDLDTNNYSYHALKVHLYEKTSTDTRYLVSSGSLYFEDTYDFSIDTISSFSYLGDTYRFKLTKTNEGEIAKNIAYTEYKYANTSYTGLFNNQNATLIFDQYEGFRIVVGSDTVLSISGASIRNQPYGGFDYNNNTLLLSQRGSNNEAPISYLFNLDLENNTFTITSKDLYFGKYTSSKMEVYLDGYGMGIINFDTKQYATTKFTYQVLGSEILITYLDTTPSFKYGTYASFYIDALYNTLTLKYLDVEEFEKEVLVNSYLTDGAIIYISGFTLKATNSVVLGRKALFDSIQIITKDGEITDNAIKIQIIDITDIDFAVKGFYHFQITINVGGNDIVMHYALQIV